MNWLYFYEILLTVYVVGALLTMLFSGTADDRNYDGAEFVAGVVFWFILGFISHVIGSFRFDRSDGVPAVKIESSVADE